jgi:hypothetical protein
MSLQHQHSQLITTLSLASAGIAAAGVVSLTALQSDTVSRWILQPARLQAKRGQEYRYKWQQALGKQSLQLQYWWSGGVHTYNAETESLFTEWLTDEAEVTVFVRDVLSKDKTLRIGRIDTANESSKEYYMWFYSTESEKIYKLPLVKLGLQLALAQERHIARTTFCFVADASAGTAAETLTDLVEAVSKDAAVLTIREPAWMIVLAKLMQQQVISIDKLSACLAAFLRLETANRVTPTQDTVVVTLPQAVVPVLLPVLQTLFPDDRHVFGYTGCVSAVQTALRLRQSARRAFVPNSLEQAVRFTDPVTVTTPLDRTLLKSPNVMKPFATALQSLPVSMADATETWMAAVDAFFALKEEEPTNGYLPYVFRLDYILNDSKDSGATVEQGSRRYWAALGLLQFVTGSRSRQVSEQTTDAVVSWLRDLPPAEAIALKAAQVEAIENCVFQHKLILIAHKTLKDTVQPAQHWTLKAAAKRGCACCLPEKDDDDDDMQGGSTLNMTLPGAFATARTSNVSSTPSSQSSQPKYADGKMGFAFDPTKFS